MRKVIALARTFLKTVRHFFPELPGWLDQLPDTRFQPMVEYHRRFLCWWGLLLFGLGLGSRRSADNDLRDLECAILHNLNLLAGTQQDSLPVTKTLDHFIGHVGSAAFAQLLHQHTLRLIRMKALDDFRFQGDFIAAVDGTGYLSFSHHHCSQCLTQKHSSGNVSYLHPVLEAKLLTTTGLALSLASEFIENPPGRTPADYQEKKQDCELKAFDRLARTLKASFPQLRLCLSFDSLYGCGRAFAVCQKYHWHFVVTFKEGRTPELWQEFQALLKLCPEQKRTVTLPDKTRRVYRWVEQLPYIDSEKRSWTLGRHSLRGNLPHRRKNHLCLADQFGGQPGFGHRHCRPSRTATPKNRKRRLQRSKKQRLEPGARLQPKLGPCQGLLLPVAARPSAHAAVAPQQPASGLGQTIRP